MVYTCGGNAHGITGRDIVNDNKSHLLGKITLENDVVFTYITIGIIYVLLLSDKGKVYGFGQNDNKQLTSQFDYQTIYTIVS